MHLIPLMAYRGVKIGAAMELENIRTYDMPWRRRFWLYCQGFTSSRGVIYDLTDERVGDYLNDIHTQKVRLQYTDWNDGEILKNKLRFHELFSRTHPQHVPELLAVWDPDQEGEAVSGTPFVTVDDLVSKAAERRLVVKPRWGADGDDVHVIGHDDDRPVVDNVPVTEPELRETLERQPESIVTEYVPQAAYAARIYPDASNTIRILVMVDPDTGSPFIASAAHRFGTRDSGHVDNWGSGGLSVHVDVDTGVLGTAARSNKGNGEFARVEEHPDTGAPITGRAIPAWKDVREGVLNVAEEYKDSLKYVGWDVVVTGEDGSFAIIEGNAAPGIHVHQTHEPLLVDDRVNRFFEHHGVL